MLTLVLEGNALVVGVVPGLRGEAGVTLPDLHLGAVGGSCGDKVSAIRLL